MAKVVTFGEIMLRLAPPNLERPFQSPMFVATFGGGEANVAVSTSNYGIPSAFVTALPVRTGTIEQTVNGDARRGKTLYASCGACHGAQGEGNQVMSAPALAGQSDWYLVRQLDKYRSGARGYDPADALGNQMKAAAAVLAEERDVQDVVAYINTLMPH